MKWVLVGTFLMLLCACKVNNAHRFTYRVSLNDEKDSAQIVVKQSHYDSIRGSVRSIDDKAVPFPSVIFDARYRFLKVGVAGDSSGYFKLSVPPGRYLVRVSSVSFLTLEKEIEIFDSSGVEIQVSLAKSEWYSEFEIESETELSKNKIARISKCLRKHRSEVSNCRWGTRYRIIILD